MDTFSEKAWNKSLLYGLFSGHIFVNINLETFWEIHIITTKNWFKGGDSNQDGLRFCCDKKGGQNLSNWG